MRKQPCAGTARTKRLEEELHGVAELSDTILAQAIELKHDGERLERRVRERTEELEIAHQDAIYMLAAAAEAKDDDTGEHVRRMQQLSYDLCGTWARTRPNPRLSEKQRFCTMSGSCMCRTRF